MSRVQEIALEVSTLVERKMQIMTGHLKRV